MAKAIALAANFTRNAADAICKVDLDFSDVLEPDLGLELPGEAIAGASRLVDDLIENGLATPEKGDALRDLTERRVIGRIEGPLGL